MTRRPMTRRLRSILLIAAVVAILLAAALTFMRGLPVEPPPPPLPSEQAETARSASEPV